VASKVILLVTTVLDKVSLNRLWQLTLNCVVVFKRSILVHLKSSDL